MIGTWLYEYEMDYTVREKREVTHFATPALAVRDKFACGINFHSRWNFTFMREFVTCKNCLKSVIMKEHDKTDLSDAEKIEQFINQ